MFMFLFFNIILLIFYFILLYSFVVNLRKCRGKNMSDNYRYNLWDEVWKLRNREVDNFSCIVEALKEKYKQIEKIDFKKQKYKPKKEKSETQQQENNKITTIKLNELYIKKYNILYKINTDNDLLNLEKSQQIIYK